jgi:hypothetical protein
VRTVFTTAQPELAHVGVREFVVVTVCVVVVDVDPVSASGTTIAATTTAVPHAMTIAVRRLRSRSWKYLDKLVRIFASCDVSDRQM